MGFNEKTHDSKKKKKLIMLVRMCTVKITANDHIENKLSDKLSDRQETVCKSGQWDKWCSNNTKCVP